MDYVRLFALTAFGKKAFHAPEDLLEVLSGVEVIQLRDELGALVLDRSEGNTEDWGNWWALISAAVLKVRSKSYLPFFTTSYPHDSW
jgi:hypothetical protein